MIRRDVTTVAFIAAASLLLGGCTVIFQTGRRSDVEKIEKLSQELDELQQAKSELESRLSQEIQDKQVSLKMMEKGLVITFLTDVLFDAGKATIKSETYPTLDKISQVLQQTVPDLKVGIEGHTDNQPIKYSGWKSNWELASARALSVLHYLVDTRGMTPQRISAIGYGEFQPVASNESEEGRRLNRRVEVVIMPRVKKVKDVPQSQEQVSQEPVNLK